MEKLTKEELEELAERGRLLFLAAKGQLEPKDFVAYSIYKQQEEQRRNEFNRKTLTDKTEIQANPTDDENPVIDDSATIEFSKSASDNSIPKGRYIRKKTLVTTPPIETEVNDIAKWKATVTQWIDEKLLKINKSNILYQIMLIARKEYISADQPQESYSETFHDLVYTLLCSSKRIPRVKGTIHTISGDIEKKRNENSRKEWVSLLNDTLLLFNRASPSSTANYSEKMEFLANLIISKIFNNCHPIHKFDDAILKEIKEAHKNSSAAYRRFTNTITKTRKRSDSKRNREEFEDFGDQQMDDYPNDFLNIASANMILENGVVDSSSTAHGSMHYDFSGFHSTMLPDSEASYQMSLTRK